ncbi:MAG: thioredoxin-disulfide reductase [SAR324 cluster bacterium]|jgi:thioredoxin reductase (NADPH)|nr:thioredoxin-disulfide reductase [SAR324 cluster bacterium]MEC7886725.1 thioredoxin-disulfide reductase [SAR324 cluster bacterium]MEC9012001.1 thioredoxin-disulfide reductase [SAR324 cluster bacterium]MEC9461037.1 thioredoxin-disulfide reductase [SAR324 cluster bacterium]MED5435131.1 thioredoxin-disulfide reductase [SAR324 cluster bacterium]
MPTKEQHHKLIILGSGPAGLTAAIYAARAILQPVVVSGREAGGQLMITSDVENYPGFPEGIKGPEMMDLLKAQAARFGTEFFSGDVIDVDLSRRPFKLTLENKDTLSCDSLIISTGASARWLGMDSEKEYSGRGVSACATCDGFFFRDQDVAVVGGGDTALEEALYLANICKSVTLIHRRDEFRGSKIMQKRAVDHEKISIFWDTVVDEVLGNPMAGMTSLKVKNVKTEEVTEHAITGLFVAIGHSPNTKLFKDKLNLNENGYVEVTPGTTYTSVEGVFASGDVQDHVYRQAVTAAGTGCMAAIDAERWLAEQTG